MDLLVSCLSTKNKEGIKMEYLDQKNVKSAVKVLQNNEVLALPTETVYGICVTYDSKEAFDKMVNVKRRSPDKPFALACASVDQALNYINVNKHVEALMRKFLPGELTVLVNAKKDLPWHATLGTNVIGIRIPAYKYITDLLEELGKPVLLTSANISGEPTSRNYDEVLGYFHHKIGGIVSGECISQVASTIIDLSKDDKITLIRKGPIPFEKIMQVWEETK